MNSRLTLAAVAAAASLFFSSDSAAQAKSSIQDDPKSSNCTENCVDAGYEWAIANEPTTTDDCAASNSDFAEGCDHWLREQDEKNALPLEEPAEAPMDAAAMPTGEEPGAPDDAATPMMPEEAAPADDSAAAESNGP
jgi:hypothetical protein